MFDILKSIVGEQYVCENEPMGEHCTFRCGGNAKYYVKPGSINELTDVIKACKKQEYPYMVIGNGSNILIKDEGYDGVIIEVNNHKNLPKLLVNKKIIDINMIELHL